MNVHIASMYWDNIPPPVLQGQRRVFDALGVPLQQQRADRVRHGTWMNRVVASLGDEEVVVFFDIDAFPLGKAIVDRAIAIARDGGIFGLAQTANHRPTRDQVYAGPMFLAFSGATHRRLGRPSLETSAQFDAGQALTAAAQAQDVPVELLYPSACIVPKFALADRGVFGIGTFYGAAEAFHLFESRDARNLALFDAVVDDTAAGRPLNFARYLEIAQHQEPPPPRRKRGWRRWLPGA